MENFICPYNIEHIKVIILIYYVQKEQEWNINKFPYNYRNMVGDVISEIIPEFGEEPIEIQTNVITHAGIWLLDHNYFNSSLMSYFSLTNKSRKLIKKLLPEYNIHNLIEKYSTDKNYREKLCNVFVKKSGLFKRLFSWINI